MNSIQLNRECSKAEQSWWIVNGMRRAVKHKREHRYDDMAKHRIILDSEIEEDESVFLFTRIHNMHWVCGLFSNGFDYK